MSKQNTAEPLENQKKDIESNQAYQFADLIIVFIGLSMFFLPAISYETDIPREFIFGATLSSFLLALSDGLLISERMSIKVFAFYGFCFVAGVMSIIYVPIVLTMYPEVLPHIEPFSDVLTIMALGFVLVVVGVRSFIYKQKIQQKLKANLASIEEEIELKTTELNQIKITTSEIINDVKKHREDIEKHGRDVQVHGKEIETTMRLLNDENIMLKNEVKRLEDEKNKSHQSTGGHHYCITLLRGKIFEDVQCGFKRIKQNFQ